jgi:hypothetical protein
MRGPEEETVPEHFQTAGSGIRHRSGKNTNGNVGDYYHNR